MEIDQQSTYIYEGESFITREGISRHNIRIPKQNAYLAKQAANNTLHHTRIGGGWGGGWGNGNRLMSPLWRFRSLHQFTFKFFLSRLSFIPSVDEWLLARSLGIQPRIENNCTSGRVCHVSTIGIVLADECGNFCGTGLGGDGRVIWGRWATDVDNR